MFETPTLKLMWLTVNRKCNFRCAWCYGAGSGYQEEEMPLSLALSLLEISTKLGTSRVFLIGGEPTLWSDLLSFNKIAKSAGVRTVLVTNAYRFSDDEFWEGYLEDPNSHIGASFKAFDPKSLEANVGAVSFNRATKGLRRVCEYQKDSVISFVYSQHYTSHLLDMVKYAVDCGAFGVAVNFCSPALCGDQIDGRHMVDPATLVKEIMSVYEEANSVSRGRLVFVIKHPLCLWPKEFIQMLKAKGQISTTCHLQHQSGGVFDTDGSLLLCNSMLGFPVGRYGQDFSSPESFSTFFGSQQMRDNFSELRKFPSDKCVSCEIFEDCSGGCPLLWTVHDPSELVTGW